MESDSEDLDYYKDFSSNTGPDILLMLNQILAESVGLKRKPAGQSKSVPPEHSLPKVIRKKRRLAG